MSNGLNFHLVRDVQLRAILERDWSELTACHDVGASKSVLILAGSLIEAVLVDYFLAHLPAGKTDVDILKMELAPLIAEARAAGVISDRAKELSTVVRTHRNLVHPGRERRLAEKFDQDSAEVARALVRMIVGEVTSASARNNAMTAEQVLETIERDPQGVWRIGEYLVEKTHRLDRERLLPLLFDAARPLRPESLWHRRSAILHVHSIVKTRMPADLLREQVRRESIALTKGLDALAVFVAFYGDNLDHLDPDDRDAVVRYFIATIGESEQTRVMELCGYSFIGGYASHELERQIVERLAMFAWHPVAESTVRAVADLSTMFASEAIKRVKADLISRRVQSAVVEAFDDIPF